MPLLAVTAERYEVGGAGSLRGGAAEMPSPSAAAHCSLLTALPPAPQAIAC